MHLARMMLGALGLLLATVFGATALLALGGSLSPRLDALAHLAPLLAAGLAIAALLAAAGSGLGRMVALGFAVLGTLAVAGLMAPEFLRSTGPAAAKGAPGEIKVIQFNAWRENRNLDRIVAWLKVENPDFALIEESTPELRDLIRRRTGWNVAGAGTTAMIFSRDHYVVMHRPVVARNTPITWVNATYDNPGGPIEVVVTHFAWPTEPAHAQQSVALRTVVTQLPRGRMILGGDFNSTPWSFQRRRDDTGFGLIRRDRALATWPTGHAGPWRWLAPVPVLPIDHIYAGAGWATTSVRRGPRLGSDHYPLVVTLAPVAQP